MPSQHCCGGHFCFYENGVMAGKFKGIDTPEKLLDMWLDVAPVAAKHLEEAARHGWVPKKKPVLTEAQIAAGYELIEVPNSLQYDKLIVDKMMPQIGDRGVVEELSKMSFAEMQDMVFNDGCAGAIDNEKKLKTYLLYGADYSNIDQDDPEVKKNWVQSY